MNAHTEKEIAGYLARIATVLEFFRHEHERIHGSGRKACEDCGRVSGHSPGCDNYREE